VTTNHNKISKQGFKLAKRHWLGKSIQFWVDDFLEKGFPRTIAQGENEIFVMGECEAFNYTHTVRGEFDLYDLVPNDLTITDSLYNGVVTEMTFDKLTSTVTFIVNKVAKVAASIKVLTHETKPALH